MKHCHMLLLLSMTLSSCIKKFDMPDTNGNNARKAEVSYTATTSGETVKVKAFSRRSPVTELEAINDTGPKFYTYKDGFRFVDTGPTAATNYLQLNFKVNNFNLQKDSTYFAQPMSEGLELNSLNTWWEELATDLKIKRDTYFTFLPVANRDIVKMKITSKIFENNNVYIDGIISAQFSNVRAPYEKAPVSVYVTGTFKNLKVSDSFFTSQ